MEKFSDAVDQEVVKNTKFNTLSTKVNRLEKNTDATTIFDINQYNTNKKNLEQKIRDVDKKMPDTSGLVTTTVLNTEFNEVEDKIPNTSNLVTTIVLNTKTSELENKFPDNSKYITTQEFNKILQQD